MKFDQPVLTFIDKLKGWHLVLLLVLSIVCFACAYQFASCASKTNGILAIDTKGANKKADFIDALYFSIVTEATLGYGDIRPVGISRIFACLQVAVGLLLAGLFVTKVTSSRGRKFRRVSIKSNGNWLEIFLVKDTGSKLPSENRLHVAFVEMFYDGDDLHYNGTNYNMAGQEVEDFTGLLISVTDNVLSFYFKNFKNKLFNDGVSVVTFKPAVGSKTWNFYEAELFDLGRGGNETIFYGVRASKKQTQIMLSNKTVEKQNLIAQLIEDNKEVLTEKGILNKTN